VATPITSPRVSITGPPEEPDEMGAEIWIIDTPSTVRWALTRPSLKVLVCPSGLPMA
jgi:hypothetical protein